MQTTLAYYIGDLPLTPNNTLSDTYSSTSTLINIIIRNSLTAAGVIFLCLLIFGGITFIMNAGSGDSKKASQGKSAIVSAVIGFAVIITAYLIIKIVEAITGLSILNSGL